MNSSDIIGHKWLHIHCIIYMYQGNQASVRLDFMVIETQSSDSDGGKSVNVIQVVMRWPKLDPCL